MTRQLPPVTAAAVRRRLQTRLAAPRPGWLATGLAVACLAAAVAVGDVAISAQHNLDAVRAQNTAVAAVLAAPDARIARRATSRGGKATVVVSRAEDAMVVVTSGLPALPASRVYQLWFLGPPGVRSAGLLPASVAGRTAPVASSGLLPGDRVSITVEPAGGTSRPTTSPILLMSLPG